MKIKITTDVRNHVTSVRMSIIFLKLIKNSVNSQHTKISDIHFVTLVINYQKDKLRKQSYLLYHTKKYLISLTKEVKDTENYDADERY